jgi:hypothetical protein
VASSALRIQKNRESMGTCEFKPNGRPLGDTRSHTTSVARWEKIVLGAACLIFLLMAGVFVHFYVQFARIIDARFDGNVFDRPAVILAAPAELQVGQEMKAVAIATHLRKAGYTEGQQGRGVGTYKATGSELEIRPGPESFFRNGRRLGACRR